jgi:hypothetical protein
LHERFANTYFDISQQNFRLTVAFLDRTLQEKLKQHASEKIQETITVGGVCATMKLKMSVKALFLCQYTTLRRLQDKPQDIALRACLQALAGDLYAHAHRTTHQFGSVDPLSDFSLTSSKNSSTDRPMITAGSSLELLAAPLMRRNYH